MQFREVLVEEIVGLLDKTALDRIPFYQHPHFLLLSSNHLKKNEHILRILGIQPVDISPFYLWIKNSQGSTIGFLPVLHINANRYNLYLSPASNLRNSLLPIQIFNSDPQKISQRDLEKAGYPIKYYLSLMGWDIRFSLFSIFEWFPKEDIKRIIDEKYEIQLNELSYCQGRKILKDFYGEHLMKIKDFPALIMRDPDLFQKYFSKNYHLILVEANKQAIGIISFIEYQNKFYLMEFLGNSLFNKLYPKILFRFFQLAKKEKAEVIYTAFFEWCLTPFISEIMMKSKSANISNILKKSFQMSARNLKEINII